MKRIRKKLKIFFLAFKDYISFLRKGIKRNHKWYGNEHAGFYVCPDNLNENSIIYSFGIGEDISFDLALIENHNCSVFGFDPTPKSIEWIKKQKLPANFHFFEYGIGCISGSIDFYLPKNPEHVSGSIIIQSNVNTEKKIKVKMKSIFDIIKELEHEKIDILKLDIEGAEYDIIKDILNAKIPITQILIEFHDRFVIDGMRKTKQTVNKMKSNGYSVFAISESKEEISFIKKNT